MEPLKKERDVGAREDSADDNRGIFSYLWPFRPVRLLVHLLWIVLRLFKPLAPHLIPLAVFSITLPLIIFLSLGSGYLVWKSVAVSWETELFLQYGDGASPYAEVLLSNVVAQQPYDISLHLIVPANDANLALGNFMASLTLLTSSNSTIAFARKPAIVLPPYTAPWSYFYNRPGTVDLNVQMLNDFVVGTSRALARVELGRHDQWKSIGNGYGRELSVLSGHIRGVVIHHGVRGLISRFPLISGLFAAMIFFFILFVGLAACLMPIVEWHFPSESQEMQPMEPEDKPRKRRRSRRSDRESEEKERTSKRRSGDSSSSRRQSRDTRMDIKNEREDEWDPSMYQDSIDAVDVPVTPSLLRQRTSRQAQNEYFNQ